MCHFHKRPQDSFGNKFPRVFVSVRRLCNSTCRLCFNALQVGAQGMEEYTFALSRLEEFLAAKLAPVHEQCCRITRILNVSGALLR
jgi:hypothetical protein